MSRADPDLAERLLRDRFGFSAFRGIQRALIDRTLAGAHSLGVMPTGAGKSLCYQLAALARPGTGIILSPLIALMEDQVRSAEAIGIRAAALTSASDDPAAIRRALRDGALDLLYVAPERATGDGFARLMEEADIALFAIDEAHCVSEWGHDFRPDYRQLLPLLDRFAGIPRLALTATADPRTRRDIAQHFAIADDGVLVAGFDRPNIRYHLAPRDRLPDQLKPLLADRPGPAIIYAPSRTGAEKIAEQVARSGRPAAVYHAGLDPALRRTNQRAFVASEEMVMAATIAFGMGIDKPDVRSVIHAAAPKSIEAYYQETGRAGRDGDPAEAWLFWSAEDFARARRRIETEVEESRRPAERARLDALAAFCEAATCRRAILLRHFGEEAPDQCGNCDNCLDPPQMIDVTTLAQKILSAAFRTGMRFGVAHLAAVLTGDDNEKVRSLGHHSLSVFGIANADEAPLIRAVARSLIARDALRADDYGGLSFGPAARPILKGEAKLTIATPPPRQARRKERAAALTEMMAPAAAARFDALRAWRRAAAAAAGVPPYVLFHDKVLRAVAVQCPASLAQLAAIEGIGEAKLARHGEALLAVMGEME